MFLGLTAWEMVGGFGIWCIEASYLPQIYRLFRLKQAEDISLFFPGLNLLGRIMAFAFSFHMGVDVLAFGFFVGILFRATLLGQVLWYRWGRPRWIAEPRPLTPTEIVPTGQATPAMATDVQ